MIPGGTCTTDLHRRPQMARRSIPSWHAAGSRTIGAVPRTRNSTDTVLLP